MTRVVGVGASAGGLDALLRIVRTLPADLPIAICIVLHVPATGRSLLGPVCALARLTIANADSIEERRPHAPREDGGLRTGGARDFSAP